MENSWAFLAFGVSISLIVSSGYAKDEELDPAVAAAASRANQEMASVSGKFESQARDWSKRYEAAYSLYLDGKGAIPKSLNAEFYKGASDERKELAETRERTFKQVKEAADEVEAAKLARGKGTFASRSKRENGESDSGSGSLTSGTSESAKSGFVLDGSSLPKEIEFNGPKRRTPASAGATSVSEWK